VTFYSKEGKNIIPVNDIYHAVNFNALLDPLIKQETGNSISRTTG
jgi:hypothetical protein